MCKTILQAPSSVCPVIKPCMILKLACMSETIYQWRIQDFPLEGGADLRRGRFSAEMYAKIKELPVDIFSSYSVVYLDFRYRTSMA